LGIFRFVCRGKVSAKARDLIKRHAADLGIPQCDVWAGNEFEERLRAHAEPLLRRFVGGVPFPESRDELAAFALTARTAARTLAPRDPKPRRTVDDVVQRYAADEASRSAAARARADGTSRVLEEFETQLAELVRVLDGALRQAGAALKGVEVTEVTTSSLHASFKGINIHLRADRGLYAERPCILWIFSKLGSVPSKTTEISRRRLELKASGPLLLWDGRMSHDALATWALEQLLSHASRGNE
jgi:hypothetical protein